MQTLNYETNVYLAVSLSANSPYLVDPSLLASVHPALTHVGLAIGQMQDVQLLSVPKDEWSRVQGDVMGLLGGLEGVGRVDVQEVRRRYKRDGEEL